MIHVGIVGIGNMRLGMALRLLDRGHAVAVRDLDPDRERIARQHGATVHPDAAAAAQGRALLIVAVVDAAQCSALTAPCMAWRRALPCCCARRLRRRTSKASPRRWLRAAWTASTRRCRAARRAPATAR